MLRLTTLLACLGASLLGSGFGAQAAERLPVLASFSILADIARQVGGDRVEVASLVGPNTDAHSFEPSPADAAKVVSARLVIVNGLGFEGWIDRLVKASAGRASVVVASRGVKTIGAGSHGHGHGHDHAKDVGDPHAWTSIANAKLYVGNIRDALASADPGGRDVYAGNATAYLASLDRLDAEIRAGIAAIPAGRRRAITTHDAFAYYAREYGIRFVPLRGVGSDTEASAQDVARIIRQIRADKVPAVFLENISDPRLMERVAKEGGARIGGKLYADALSEPGGPASTYLDLMRANTRALVSALGE